MNPPATSPPAAGFDAFGLRGELLRALEEAGYTVPTPIQRLAIPPLMAGQDLIGVAQTGTGKTLAFLLPILHSIRERGADPQAVVVCPTRELAIQCAGEAERFGRHMGLRLVLAYGGTSSGDQKRALTEGCELLVGTPGRLLDFLNSAWLSAKRLRFVVLDEADRMLDMGFINDVDAIMRKTPMSRQTLLFSATFPDEVRVLSERYMFHPTMVKVDRETRVKESVDHAFYPVSDRQKVSLLLEIIDRERPAKALVFSGTREGTSELALELRRRGHVVGSLSSLLSQSNRERALEAFRRGDFRILVATDVAARGLDITDIDLVVNFDVPMHPEDYVHRIGRTGRAERAGRAVTLVTGRDQRRVAAIDRLLGEPVPRLRVEGFSYDAPGDRPPRGSRPGADGARRAEEGGGRKRGSRGRGRSSRTAARGEGHQDGSKSAEGRAGSGRRRRRRSRG